MPITYKDVRRLPVKKAHRVGTSIVVTIDPSIVKTMNIDDATFFAQEPTEGAILMKIRRLST
jgi:hypothetical protein